MGSKNMIRELCIKIVQTDGIRRENVKQAQIEIDSLTDTVKSTRLSKLPIGRSATVSDPTAKLYERIEYLAEYIRDEQKRIDAVEEATRHIGKQYQENIRKQMIDGIYLNVSASGNLPFQDIDYPFESKHFYNARKIFLHEIALLLHFEY